MTRFVNYSPTVSVRFRTEIASALRQIGHIDSFLPNLALNTAKLFQLRQEEGGTNNFRPRFFPHLTQIHMQEWDSTEKLHQEVGDMNAQIAMTKTVEQTAATAKLIFGGEQFVSLPKVATILQEHFGLLGYQSVSVSEASLTSLKVIADEVCVLLDVAFESRETHLAISADHMACANKSMVALAGALYPLAKHLPVAAVIWAGTDLRIPRETFVQGLAGQFGRVADPAAASDAMETGQQMPVAETAATGTIPQIAPRRVVASRARSIRPLASPANLGLPADIILSAAGRAPTRMAANTSSEPRTTSFDAHVRAYEAHTRSNILQSLSEGDADIADTNNDISLEARLSTWAVSLTVATVSLPVAAPVMIYNVARGEDMRVASLSMGLAGLFLALESSGAMAAVGTF